MVSPTPFCTINTSTDEAVMRLIVAYFPGFTMLVDQQKLNLHHASRWQLNEGRSIKTGHKD